MSPGDKAPRISRGREVKTRGGDPKMLMKIRNRQKGFTLIELLIVVAIIGITAALLIPNFLDALQKAKQKRTVADMRNTGTAMFSWLTDQVGAAAAGPTASSSAGRRRPTNRFSPLSGWSRGGRLRAAPFLVFTPFLVFNRASGCAATLSPPPSSCSVWLCRSCRLLPQSPGKAHRRC